MHPEGIIAIMAVFSIPLLAIWTGHRRRMLEMQLMLRGQNNQSGNSEIEALRAEMRALRDTTTQYDLSFDSALQRIERRVDGLEQQNLSSSDQQSRIGTLR